MKRILLTAILTTTMLFAANFEAVLDSTDGSSGFDIQDSTSASQCFVDSDGNMVIKGGMRLDSAGFENTSPESLIIDGALGVGVLTISEKITTNGAVKIGPAIGVNDGTVQYDGNDFLGRAGGNWHSLTPPSYVKLEHQESAGTDGGSSGAGSWVTRTLNTEVSDTENLCTLEVNDEFTLSQGTYRFSVSSPSYMSDNHQIRLWCSSHNQEIAIGTAEFSSSTNGAVTRSHLACEYTFPEATRTFRVEHRVATTRNTDGFGLGSTWANSVFTIVEIWKLN